MELRILFSKKSLATFSIALQAAFLLLALTCACAWLFIDNAKLRMEVRNAEAEQAFQSMKIKEIRCKVREFQEWRELISVASRRGWGAANRMIARGELHQVEPCVDSGVLSQSESLPPILNSP